MNWIAFVQLLVLCLVIFGVRVEVKFVKPAFPRCAVCGGIYSDESGCRCGACAEAPEREEQP